MIRSRWSFQYLGDLYKKSVWKKHASVGLKVEKIARLRRRFWWRWRRRRAFHVAGLHSPSRWYTKFRWRRKFIWRQMLRARLRRRVWQAIRPLGGLQKSLMAIGNKTSASKFRYYTYDWAFSAAGLLYRTRLVQKFQVARRIAKTGLITSNGKIFYGRRVVRKWEAVRLVQPALLVVDHLKRLKERRSRVRAKRALHYRFRQRLFKRFGSLIKWLTGAGSYGKKRGQWKHSNKWRARRTIRSLIRRAPAVRFTRVVGCFFRRRSAMAILIRRRFKRRFRRLLKWKSRVRRLGFRAVKWIREEMRACSALPNIKRNHEMFADRRFSHAHAWANRRRRRMYRFRKRMIQSIAENRGNRATPRYDLVGQYGSRTILEPLQYGSFGFRAQFRARRSRWFGKLAAVT